jgi:hypothetical protein
MHKKSQYEKDACVMTVEGNEASFSVGERAGKIKHILCQSDYLYYNTGFCIFLISIGNAFKELLTR